MPPSPKPSRRRVREPAASTARPPQVRFSAIWCALLPLAAVALGGSTARWSEGVLLCAIGLTLLITPPRTSLGWRINLVLTALFALACTAFLPAHWFHQPAWRTALTDDFGATLPGTLSPQPILAAECIVTFLAGIGWFYLIATRAWNSSERTRAGRLFAGGVVGLAALFIALAAVHWHPSFWHSEFGFGPFPNRNQTADFLAVGALPVLACAYLAWRAGNRAAAVAWVIGWSVVAAALFQNFSRAGIGILFIGTSAYLAYEAFRATRRKQNADAGDVAQARAMSARWRAVTVAASLTLLLASGFMLFGGATLERLRPASVNATVSAATGEFRLRIQRDTLDMMADSPWCGVGIGSFSPVFATYRQRSAVDLSVVHPESDWLWLGSELGWPAIVLLLGGCVLLAARAWPQRSAVDRPLRTAAAFAVVAFALHGLVDVSAHRLGTALCGIFLLGLALPGARDDAADFRRPAIWPALLFRGLALALIALGALWLAADSRKLLVPGSQEVERLESLAQTAAANRDDPGAIVATSRALEIDPLNWRMYFQRALSRLGAGENHADALADFRRALYLDPFMASAAQAEARAWAAAGEPDLAISALLEACRRAPNDAQGYFVGAASAADGDPEFVPRLVAAASSEPGLELLALAILPDKELGRSVREIVAAQPDLRRFDPSQRIAFFRLWSRGDPTGLTAAMDKNPAWQTLGWRWWADACAQNGAVQRACEIAAQFAPRPALPTESTRPSGASVAQARIAVARAPNDLAAGLRLFFAQQQAGDVQGSLATLHQINSRPDAPAYAAYLEADTASRAGWWDTAWPAWRRYLSTLPGAG